MAEPSCTSMCAEIVCLPLLCFLFVVLHSTRCCRLLLCDPAALPCPAWRCNAAQPSDGLPCMPAFLYLTVSHSMASNAVPDPLPSLQGQA